MSLDVEHVTVRIEGRIVLNEVSLAVGAGEIVALLGPDGAGKTVCFEALAGLTTVVGGRLVLQGTDLTDLPAEQRALLGLSYLPEEPSIFRGLTVAENIAVALEATEQADARSKRLESLLEAFDLGTIREQMATTLSGGERRRCELARATATDPVVLMLDEPFRGLDPMGVREVRQSMLGLKARRIGLLVSDYDLHDLLGITDRAYVLHNGQIVFSGTPADLTKDADVRQVYLGETFSA